MEVGDDSLEPELTERNDQSLDPMAMEALLHMPNNTLVALTMLLNTLVAPEVLKDSLVLEVPKGSLALDLPNLEVQEASSKVLHRI